MAGWDFLDTLDSPQPKEVDGNWSFLDTLDSPQKPIARQPSGESFQDVSNRSLLDEFALGINRGTEQLKSSLYGFGGIVGSIIGNESLKQAGFKGFQEHEAEAAKYPKAVNLKDVTLGTFPSLLVGTIGEVVPSMVEAAATTLAGTILGAATGTAVAPVGGTVVGAAGGAAGGAATGLAGIFARQAGRNLMKEAAESFVKKGIARETAEVMAKEEVKKIATNELVKMGARAAGSKAGMFAGVLPMESGGNWGEALKEYGIDNPWSALATGTMASFLEFAGGNSRVIRDVLGTAEESAFRKAIASADTHAIVRIAKKAITQGGEEAAQEMGQEFLSLANIAVNDPKFEMFTKDNMWRILESGFGGLVAGAGGGVVSGIVSPKPGGKTDLTAPPDETKEQAKIILNDSERKEILKYAEDKLDELNKKDIAGTITADERAEFNFLKENSTSPEAIVSQYQPKAQPSISIDVLKGVGFTKEQIDKMDLPTISSTLQVVSKQITERAKPNADVIYDAVVDGKRGIEWHTRGGKSGFVEMGGSEQITRDSAQKAFQEAVQKEKEEAALMSKASPEEKQAYQVKSVLDRILAYFNRNAPIDPSGKEQHAKLMKGKGFQFSALRRRATGNPTDSDLKSAFKHLDSNYVGKRVRLNDGREAVVVSGKGKNVTVIFSDGIQKDVSRGNIVTPKATKAEAIEYLKQKGLDEVDQLINTYKDLFPEVFEQTKEQRKVKRITGLSPELSQLLVDNGITSEQAASLPPENVKAILGYLSTKKTTVPDDRKSMFNYVEKLFNGILGFNFEFNYFDFNLKDPIDVTTPEGVARLKELGHTLEGVLKALGVTYEQLKSKGGRISIAIQGRHHTVQGVDNRRTQSCWVFKGSDPTTVIHEALHGYWRERGFQGWNADEETVNLWLEKQFNGREFKDKAEFEDWLEQKRNEFNAAQPKTKEGVSAGTRYKTGEASRAPPGFKSLQERAAEIFGHTEFFEEAGFINNDGNLLDFSGRSLPPEQRHPGGYRALEHRYISWITGEEHPIASIWKYLLTGAIRVDGKMGAIELGERPTLEQIDKIYTLAEKFNGNIVVDLHEWKNVPEKPDYGFLLNNDRLWGDQYDKGTSPQKIISDINKFYDGGTPVVKHINYKVGELSLDERLKGVPEKFKDKPVTLTHWSHKRGLRTLNPKYFGTGFAGQERDRFGKSYVPQMYYGVKGYTKEHGLGKETYKGLVEGNDLYNRDYDPLNLMPTPKDLTRRGFAPFDQNEKHNLYDRRIKEAGYKGMYSETYDVVCMFTPVEVEQVKPRQTAYKTGEIMPGFYSQLITVVDKHLKEMPSKIQSIIGYLERKQVKPAELKWMAVEQWLKENEVNGVIDKQKFLQFLKDNQIEIQEVTKGAGEWKGDEYFVNGNREANVGYSDGEGWYFESDTSEATEIFETKAEAMKAAEEDVIGLYGKAETKFAQYQLPGGENYRELLLTLPIQHETLKYDLKNVNPILPGEYEATNPDMFWYFRAPDQVYQIPKSRYPNEGEAREYVIQRKTPAVEADYKSSHWDEPNVLAHVRMNDRVDADGKKVLFLEEVQSDWHQEGKKKGYQGKETPPAIEKDGDKWKVTLANGEVHTGFANREKAEEFSSLNIVKSVGGIGVPPAPFAENWHELVMKRMLRYAAENGYDKVAWTTGEQQAERYDLAKYIDSVTATKGADAIRLKVDLKNGETEYTLVKEDDLEKYVGKDLAIKIKNQTEQVGEYSGLDLKVGGEGMGKFYDQLIPGFMNRYVKQWGAKVGESKIDTTTKRGDAWVVYQDGEVYDGFRTEKQAKDFIGQFAKEDQNRFEIKYEGDTARTSTVPSVDITPSMKTDVLEKGQPLYKVGKITPAQDAAYMDAVESGDMKTAQKMVDEAAKKAGYDVEGLGAVYHGTPNVKYNDQWVVAISKIHSIVLPDEPPLRHDVSAFDENTENYERFWKFQRFLSANYYRNFQNKIPKDLRYIYELGQSVPFTIFDETLRGSTTEAQDAKRGFFFTKDEPFAQRFRRSYEYDRITRMTKVVKGPGPIYKVYLKTGNVLDLTKMSAEQSKMRQKYDDLGGYDTVINKVKWRPNMNRTTSKVTQEIMVRNSSQIKSADPVTYDDQGNVIPLSQRFNPENPDIRYSIGKVSLEQEALKYDTAEEFVKAHGKNVYYHSTTQRKPFDKFKTKEVYFETQSMPGYGERDIAIHYEIKNPFVTDTERAEDWGISKEQAKQNHDLFEEWGGEVNKKSYDEMRKRGHDTLVDTEGYAALYPERVTVLGDMIEKRGMPDTEKLLTDIWNKAHEISYKTGNSRDIGTYILSGETRPKSFTKVSEIAKYLTEQGAKAGVIDWQTATGRQNKTVENSLRKFYEICAKRFPESLEWYKQDIETTFNILEEIYPELKERGNRGMMTLALAITSNGNETTKNVELASNVYENYKSKKRFSMTLDATRKETIDTHLALARKLRKNFNSDEEFIDWLLEVKTAREIKNEVSKILGISAEDAHVIISNTSDDFRIPRAAMFGSKIGSFFANMNGDYSHLTTDMWFMRTVGRITGDLSTVDEDIFNQKQEEFIQSVENAPKAGRLVSWQKGLFSEDIEPYVLSLERRFSNEKFRDAVNALEGGEELRKITNSFAKYIKGNLKESPSSGSHRQWLYDRIKNITKPGEDMASVQAAMWIGEKEVYRELGAKQKKGDYFSKGASVLWEKHFGRPFGGIAKGTGRTGRNIRSAFTKNIESEGRGIETKLFKKIYDVVMNRPDGFTIEVSNGENQTKGWVVSPAKETELRLDKFTRQDAIDYLNKFKKVFESDPRAFFGGWFDTQTNQFVLDISFIVEDKETALYLAEIGNQDAVFHLDDLGTDINPEVRREDGIKELRQSGVYSESKRDSLRGVRESLLTEIRRARVDTTQSSLFKTGEITLEEVEDESQKIVLEQAKRAAAPKKEYVFTPKKNVPLTVQRNIPPEFQDVVYETIANDEEIAKADSIMTSKEAVIRYATHPELIPAGIRKTAAMVSAINFAQKLNDPELFMILGGKDSFLKYSSYVAQELQLLRELYKDSPAIAIREINIVRETEAVKKDSNIKQRAKEQTNVGKQTVKADVNRSINKEATRRLIDLIKC